MRFSGCGVSATRVCGPAAAIVDSASFNFRKSGRVQVRQKADVPEAGNGLVLSVGPLPSRHTASCNHAADRSASRALRDVSTSLLPSVRFSAGRAAVTTGRPARWGTVAPAADGDDRFGISGLGGELRTRDRRQLQATLRVGAKPSTMLGSFQFRSCRRHAGSAGGS
jgi:hypothetical protein